MPRHSSSLHTRTNRSCGSFAIGKSKPLLVTMSGTDRTNSMPATLMAERMPPPRSWGPAVLLVKSVAIAYHLLFLKDKGFGAECEMNARAQSIKPGYKSCGACRKTEKLESAHYPPGRSLSDKRSVSIIKAV